MVSESVGVMKCQPEPEPEPSLDLVGDDMEDIMSALNAFKDLVEKSSEQDQRIDSKLAFLTEKVNDSIKETASLKKSADKLDLKIKHMGETSEKSLKTLQKQVSDLDKQWEALMGKNKGLGIRLLT